MMSLINFLVVVACFFLSPMFEVELCAGLALLLYVRLQYYLLDCWELQSASVKIHRWEQLCLLIEP